MMKDDSLLELMGRVGALEAALSAILSSAHIDGAVRSDVRVSLEKMAVVLELGNDSAATAFSSGWRLAMRSLFNGAEQEGLEWVRPARDGDLE